jgi:acyl-homoserine-lactone acylase
MAATRCPSGLPHRERARLGSLPFAQQPQLERRDYVFNSNDSHWLVNADGRLEGYSPLFGPERTARSPRTRVNALLLSGPDAPERFTLPALQERLFSNRSLTAELLADAIVERCDGAPPITVDGQVVDLAPACAALAGWDRYFDRTSVGALESYGKLPIDCRSATLY